MNFLKYIINIPAFVIGLFFSVPILGRLVALVWRGTIDIFWRILSIPDVILWFLGFQPEKKMRLSVVILTDEEQTPIVKMDNLKEILHDTIETYKESANVRVTVDKIHTMITPAPAANLNPSCNSRAVLDDLWTAGTYFENVANTHLFDTTFQRIIGYAAPVIVFVVQEVKGGDIGCSLGPFTDYVVIEGGKPKCIAHEVAHAVGLWHVKTKDNLANHFCGPRHLEPWQIAIVRSSRHVTYL